MVKTFLSILLTMLQHLKNDGKPYKNCLAINHRKPVALYENEYA